MTRWPRKAPPALRALTRTVAKALRPTDLPAPYRAAVFRVRPATGEDACFLLEMVAVAADWRPHSVVRSVEQVLASPELAHYVAEWPRDGDSGRIAEGDDGRLTGAAWWRLFPAEHPGYGFVRPDIPEVSIGVRHGYRGRGIGTDLLRQLIDDARHVQLPALSLSVEPDNPARRLYARLGFVRVHVVGGADTMLLQL